MSPTTSDCEALGIRSRILLKDESLDFILEQFYEKNEVLHNLGEPVSATSMYEDIFNDLDLVMPIVIIDDDSEGKKIQPMSIYDALFFSSGRNDVLMGGCTYFNNWISKKSSHDLYTFIIDMDNVYSNTLLRALQNDWKNENDVQYAKPTYIVNSGTGLHLYFVLNEPLPCYHSVLENIDKVYRNLAIQQSRRVYVKQDVQWFGQDFRMAGGLNKYNLENTVFKVGDKWNINDLARAVNLNDLSFIKPKKKSVKKGARGSKKQFKGEGWKTNKAFYYYALEHCKEKTKEGNRYLSMCALTVIAFKCDIDLDELESDLYNLLPTYNKGATRIVKEKEIHSAMKMYNKKAMETPRDSLERWQGWVYTPIKRNGRTRAEHLKIARYIRDEINRKKDSWREGNGRPKGSGSKEQLILDFLDEHKDENLSITEIAKRLGVSRPTVYKYLGRKNNE